MEPIKVIHYEENPESFMNELKNDDFWNKIPLMNIIHTHELIEGQLVRFCGMIQDMFDPVYYTEVFNVEDTLTNSITTRSGKFRNYIDCAPHEKILDCSPNDVTKDRLPVYCISVPAINQWAQYKKCDTKKVGDGNMDLQIVSGGKRKLGEDVEMEEDSTESRVNNEDEAAKRINIGNTSGTPLNTSTWLDLNLPLPNNTAEACIINFYDIVDGQLKINDVIEVAGFLSYEDCTSVIDSDQLPPPSRVPRLHAVTFRPVHTCNPLINPHNSLENMTSEAAALRDNLKLVLTQVLFGDDLAADYLICHLTSRIYLRQESLVLGKFSLNLTNIPCSVPDYTIQLYDFLQNLLVKSHFLPMTINNMNTINMIPKKIYEKNQLQSGLLQLSNNTHLVIDETQLMAGQLETKGVQNSLALTSVIKHQALQYDFEFYPLEFETDIPILILSQGKSILPSDYQLPIKIDDSCLSTIKEVFVAATHYLKEPLLSQLRVYLSLVGSANYNLSPDIQDLIQEDFVKMRKESPRTTAQDLHSLLVLARQLSLSQGLNSLTRENWQTAQQMELQRNQRLSSPNFH